MPSLLRQIYHYHDEPKTPYSTRISPKLCPLSLINFHPGALAPHWGLFLYSDPNNLMGTMYDLNFAVSNEANGTTISWKTLFPIHGRHAHYSVEKHENWDLAKCIQAGRSVEGIPYAGATLKRLDRAAEIIMKDFKYKFTHENCQTFIVLVLQLLRKWDPAHIPLDAIAFVRSKTAFTVRIATRREKRYNQDDVAARRRPRFTSSEQSQDEWSTPSRRHHHHHHHHYYTSSSSSSTDVFNSNIAVVPGHQQPRDSRSRNTSDSSNLFSLAIAVLPQQQGRALAARTLRKGQGRSDPVPREAHRPMRVRVQIGVRSEERERYYKVPGAWE